MNAAAVTATLVIDRAPRAVSMIADRPLPIDRRTVIENAFAGEANDLVAGNAAANRIDGRRGHDVVSGLSGDDGLSGFTGDDVLAGDDGAEVLSGGAGADRLPGGRGGDALDGGAVGDALAGGAGPDRIAGRGGDDRIAGGGGNDRLFAGGGHDRIGGGRGDDVMAGGSGPDVFVFEGRTGSDTVRGFSPAEDALDLTAYRIPPADPSIRPADGGAALLVVHPGGRIALPGIDIEDLDPAAVLI